LIPAAEATTAAAAVWLLGGRLTEGARRRGLGRDAPSGATAARTGSWARNGHHWATHGGGLEPVAVAELRATLPRVFLGWPGRSLG
jgi:hypothetical protein